MSSRTGEKLGFNMKNKQEQILANGNVCLCLSHRIKRPEKKACAPLLFSFSVSAEASDEIAGGESMACVMLAVRLHRS